LPVSCAGRGGLSASFGGGSVDRRSAGIGFAEAFSLLAGFCREIFSVGFLFESIFGFDGSADWFDTDAVCFALGFGASAGGGAEAVEAGARGAVATEALSGFPICGAAVEVAGFGASPRGGAEAVEAGAGGAVASDALSGLTICGAADAAGGFGV
jgi:hypothetical protein